MRIKIEIQKTPCLGLGKFLTLIGCSSVLPKNNWIHMIYTWVPISLNMINWLPIWLHLSVVTLCCGWSNIGRLWIYLSAANSSVQKYHKGTDSKILRNTPNPDRDPSFSGCTTLWVIINWKVMDLFVCRTKLCSNISQRNRFEICEKYKILWWFKIKHDKNNRIVVDQFTISGNEPLELYLAII